MFVGLLKVAAFQQGKHHLYVVAHIVPHLQGMLNVRNELPATREIPIQLLFEHRRTDIVAPLLGEATHSLKQQQIDRETDKRQHHACAVIRHRFLDVAER